jgi:hypothetical protein
MSAMEHLVPEMMFSTADNPAHGISAVKALQLAAAEGQKIWTITQTNLNTALAAINLPSDIKTDIRNSVNAGMELTAHERAVDFFGSSQVGYIVLDPETGAGGYLIGGGENGGEIIENNISRRLGWSQYTENSSVTSSVVNGVVNYVDFGLNYVASWVKCNEIVLNIISFMVIIILAALIVSALSLGSGAGVAIALLGMWASSAYGAKPTGGEDCKMDCSFASAFQLKAAGIEDGHAYKDSYAAIPNSRYDICACKDGSIAIFRTKQCGQMNALWEVTFERWK